MTATPLTTPNTLEIVRDKARLLRIHSIRATTAAGSGHPTSCLSCAELVAATFFHAMRFDPAHPNAIAGDRFVLSKGHAAPILYAALAESGVFPVSRLLTLRQFNSELEGHPTPLIPAWMPLRALSAKAFPSALVWQWAHGWLVRRRACTC